MAEACSKKDGCLSRRQLVFAFLFLSAVTSMLAYAFPLFARGYPDYGHLGAEYFNIANAIAHGRGFSDAFGQGSGPTSWMPPLFCLFLAGLILLLKSKSVVAVVVAVMTNFGWAFVGTVLLGVSCCHCVKIRAAFPVVTYIVWLCAFYSSYFLLAHDIWFVGVFVSIFIWQISSQIKTGRVSARSWGIIGGLSALVSPSLAIAWGAVTLNGILRQAEWRKPLCLAIALAGAIASPWAIRNAVVFHRFVPTKSNLGYDAYQAQRIDDDGVYDENSFREHPYNSLRSRREYVREGESSYVARYGQAFSASVRRHPGEYLRRVYRRILAATLAYPSTDGQDSLGPGRMLRGVFYPLPFAAAVLTLFWRGRHRGMFSAMRITYLAYVLPYGLFAFYARHLFPLTVVLVLFVVLTLDQFLCALRREPC